MSPNNLSTGLMIGVDIYDAVLIIRTQKALESFFSHKATLGTDIGVVAGPFGAGAAIEAGKEKAPVFSYVKSRGLFAGVQLVGQVFVDRYGKSSCWVDAELVVLMTHIDLQRRTVQCTLGLVSRQVIL